MPTDPHLHAAGGSDPTESLSLSQKEELERSVTKIVALGAQVGVSAEQMIQILKSGLTVRGLLEYLATLAGEVA